MRRIRLPLDADGLLIAQRPQPPRIEEITFESGSFHVVGDLRLPEGTGPFPVVLFVHGSGLDDRTMLGPILPIMERMLQAGYATFSWDKPGDGRIDRRIQRHTTCSIEERRSCWMRSRS